MCNKDEDRLAMLRAREQWMKDTYSEDNKFEGEFKPKKISVSDYLPDTVKND